MKKYLETFIFFAFVLLTATIVIYNPQDATALPTPPSATPDQPDIDIKKNTVMTTINGKSKEDLQLSTDASRNNHDTTNTIKPKMLPPPIVILIRHGEKIEWPYGAPPADMKEAKASYIDNHKLSTKGVERSYSLIGYFARREEMVSIFERQPLGAIIAQGVDHGKDGNPGKGKSERPRMTVEPLMKALQTNNESLWDHNGSGKGDGQKKRRQEPVNVKYIEYLKKDVKSMVQRIKSHEFDGQTVIISWSHQQIPALAAAFGVHPSMVPHKWGKRYDVTWILESTHGEHGKGGDGFGELELRQYPQRLLYGDEDNIIPIGKGFKGSFEDILYGSNDDEDGDE
jgi:hypothetical protein